MKLYSKEKYIPKLIKLKSKYNLSNEWLRSLENNNLYNVKKCLKFIDEKENKVDRFNKSRD